MRTRNIATVLGLLIVTLAAGAAGAGIAQSTSSGLPLSPADDTSIVHLAPGELMPVAGPDGKPIVCGDGERLLVDPMKDNPPRDVVKDVPTEGGAFNTIEGAVPRCGPGGGGPDGTPVWIPDGLARDNPTTAPAQYIADQVK